MMDPDHHTSNRQLNQSNQVPLRTILPRSMPEPNAKKGELPPQSDYHDYSNTLVEDLSDPSAFIYAAASAKEPPFPVKLYQILCNPAFKEIIGWLPHGRSWCVMKPKAFEEKVIPLHFRHCRYSSFMRQVNGWGFKRVHQGADLNSYYHELFLRGLPHLCLKMRRPTGKQAKLNAAKASMSPPPNFYEISKKNPLPDATMCTRRVSSKMSKDQGNEDTNDASSRRSPEVNEKQATNEEQEHKGPQKATVIDEKQMLQTNDDMLYNQAQELIQQKPSFPSPRYCNVLPPDALVAVLGQRRPLDQLQIDPLSLLQLNSLRTGIDRTLHPQQGPCTTPYHSLASGGSCIGMGNLGVDKLRNTLAASQLQNQLLAAALTRNSTLPPAASSQLSRGPSAGGLDLTDNVLNLLSQGQFLEDQI